MSTIQGFIYLDGNDAEAESKIKHKDDARVLVASASLSGVGHRISATKTGSAIHASLDVPATEATGEPGSYVSVFQGSDLTANLATYVHRTVYVITYKGTSIHRWAAAVVKPDAEAA